MLAPLECTKFSVIAIHSVVPEISRSVSYWVSFGFYTGYTNNLMCLKVLLAGWHLKAMTVCCYICWYSNNVRHCYHVVSVNISHNRNYRKSTRLLSGVISVVQSTPRSTLHNTTVSWGLTTAACGKLCSWRLLLLFVSLLLLKCCPMTRMDGSWDPQVPESRTHSSF